MKFCIKCDNMYYISISETNENQMIYYCRNCGDKDETSFLKDGVCVLNTTYKNGGDLGGGDASDNFHHIVNKYTKFDPTLPRIYTMKCPNMACKSNTGTITVSTSSASAVSSDVFTTSNTTKENPEIIYMRYDDSNMKYLYICVECDTTWR